MNPRNSKGQFVSPNKLHQKDARHYAQYLQVRELMEIYDISNLAELKELLQGCYIIRRAKGRAAKR